MARKKQPEKPVKQPAQSEKNKGGRPTLLTPELIEEVRKALPVLLYLHTTASYVGVDRHTFRVWAKRGAREAKRLRNPKATPKPEEAIYLQFHEMISTAIAKGVHEDLKAIKDAGQVQWQAAAWRLERRFPDQWGRDRGELAELKRIVGELEKRISEMGKTPA